MTIHIIEIEEPDVYITQAEMDRLRPLWQSEQSMTVCPVSFETWLRNKMRKKTSGYRSHRILKRRLHGRGKYCYIAVLDGCVGDSKIHVGKI